MSLQLDFGLNEMVPEGAPVAWGARLIVTQDGCVDLPPDRQGAAGEGRQEFLALLDAQAHLPTLLNAIRNLLAGGRMNTRIAEDFVIFRNDKVEVHANTNGSAGYCYLAAFPTPPTRPVVEIIDGLPVIRSSCCKAQVEVTRPVSDIVRFTPERLEDGTLWVRYSKVFEGSAGDFTASCDKCGALLDIEVEES